MIFFKILLIIFLYLINKKFLTKKTFYKKIFFYKKGEYLSRIGNCISCHTINGSKPFSGGLSLKTNFGIINTPNISPDLKNGLGFWKFKDFYNSIKLGISKNKKFLYPIFPYLNFSNIKKIDIKCIYFFLKNLKNYKIKNKLNNLKIPFKYRKILIIWRIFFFKKLKIKINKKQSIIKRGYYLIKNLGHCNMCHTYMNLLGNENKKLNLSGGYINLEKWFSSPLNNKINIKKTIKNIINLLKNGYNKNNNIFGPMSEVINNSLQYVSKIDIKSISIFIKNLFNINKFYIKNYKLIIKKYNLKLFYKKGKIVYKKYCKNCHGRNGFGNNFLSPSINKNFFNKNLINNLKNILLYNYKTYTFKKNFSYIMPFFTNIKNKNVIYLINYIFIFNILNKNFL